MAGFKNTTQMSFRQKQQQKIPTSLKVFTQHNTERGDNGSHVFFHWSDANVGPAKPNMAVIAGAALLPECVRRFGQDQDYFYLFGANSVTSTNALR